MPYFSLKRRLKIAIGGFVFFIGLLLLILAILTTTKAVNLESVLPGEFMIAVVAVLGLIDVVCGFLLFRKR